MLKPEDALKQLEKWMVKFKGDKDNVLKALDSRLKKLPAKLRNIVYALNGANEKGRRTYGEENHTFIEKQKAALLKLTAAERKKLFAAMFGKLSGDVDHAVKWISNSHVEIEYDGFLKGPDEESDLAERYFFFLNGLSDLGYFKPEILNIEWLAQWIGHLNIGWQVTLSYSTPARILLASAIDQGGKSGKSVLDILLQSLRKEHEIGVPGSHVNETLMMCGNPAAWEAVEKLLLAAQRQEGLRQTILEALPRANRTAARRMFQLIADNNLSRFSSVILAFNQWFGVSWEAKQSKKANVIITQINSFLEKPAAAKKAIKGDDAELAYFALWALAADDPAGSLKLAASMAKHESAEFRFVAASHLARLGTALATPARIALLEDEDLRVVAASIQGNGCGYLYCEGIHVFDKKQSQLLISAAKRILESDRIPKKAKKLEPCIWPWVELQIKRSDIADLVQEAFRHDAAPKVPMDEVRQLLPQMSAHHREWFVRDLAATPKKDKATRAALFEYIGDKSSYAAETALNAVMKLKVTEAEALLLEGYLSRSAAGIRNGIIQLLLKQKDAVAFQSAARLIEDKLKPRRMAALELVRHLAETDRMKDACIKLAQTYQAKHKKLTKDEQLQIDAIQGANEEPLTFEDCLGLMDLSKRTPVVAPKKHNVKAWTPATIKLLTHLENFLKKNKKVEISFISWRETHAVSVPIANVDWEFPSPEWHQPLKKTAKRFPSLDLFKDWYESLPANCKDKDGMTLLRAYQLSDLLDSWQFSDFKRFCKKSKRRTALFDYLGGNQKIPKTKFSFTDDLLRWLFRCYLPKNAVELAWQIAETTYSLVPEEDLASLTEKKKVKKDRWGYESEEETWRSVGAISDWRDMAIRLSNLGEAKPPKNFPLMHWQLLHWIDEPLPGARRDRPASDVLAHAYLKKKANLTDVYDHLLGPVDDSHYMRFQGLTDLTARTVSKNLKAFVETPQVASAIEQSVDHIFEIEMQRGESKTVATEAMLAVKCIRGAVKLKELLIALGKKGFKKNNSYRRSTEDMRDATFTSMVESTYPADTDTPETFAKMMKAELKAKTISEERLLQLAFLAPQWGKHIAATFGWPGFEEALYWFMAHMRVWGIDEALETEEDLEASQNDTENDDEDAPEKLTRWERIIRERTHLTSSEREDGAIDVGWFHNVYQQLNPKRWEALSEAARFAASAAQAKKAKLIAHVLLGKVAKSELVTGIKKRNLKENVRLLGLLPLAKGAKREKDLIDRYEVLEAYRKYANKLSSMSRPDAMRALEIGMQNLAATAGYADPMRLQWALEAASTADLAAGPLVANKGDVSLTLELDEDALPILTVQRGEKILKSLPKAVNKDPKFVELKERSKHVKKQASRVKSSLEVAMCRGDRFTGGELAQLSQHAVLWPQLQRLVLVNGKQMGYPVKKGKALKDHAGKLTTVKKNDELLIAHPYELLKSKQWPKWQRECFNIERLQPFKQVFRELYVVSTQEKKEKTFSSRYAGHQVNQRQAFALWGRRGWSVDEYGDVWKSFHNEEINVNVSFNYGVTTPLEVEGLTIENVSFTNRKNYETINLAKVPPRLFSEVMRDMDLVVSVAHVGEVDPEASASTVEMRRTLLDETCKLLNLKNVTLKAKSNHVAIKGSLGDYSIHLGSGIVHKMPGGSVCLVPVHAQHRGRLFLPFADNDPRTAEVISKTLLLSRDEEIDDPILLEQLRSL